MLSHSIYHLGRIIRTYRVVTDTGFDYYSEHEAIFTLNFIHVESIHWSILKRYLTSTLFSKICVDYKPSRLDCLHLCFVTIRDLFSAICMEYKIEKSLTWTSIIIQSTRQKAIFTLDYVNVDSIHWPILKRLLSLTLSSKIKIVYKPRKIYLRFVWYHLHGV